MDKMIQKSAEVKKVDLNQVVHSVKYRFINVKSLSTDESINIGVVIDKHDGTSPIIQLVHNIEFFHYLYPIFDINHTNFCLERIRIQYKLKKIQEIKMEISNTISLSSVRVYSDILHKDTDIEKLIYEKYFTLSKTQKFIEFLFENRSRTWKDLFNLKIKEKRYTECEVVTQGFTSPSGTIQKLKERRISDEIKFYWGWFEMHTIREFICYNQRQIIRFEYTISELHRTLKDAVREALSKDKLEEAYNKLLIDGFMLMESIFQENNEFVMNTLGEADKNLRFTIKMVDDPNVIDIYRNHKIDTFMNEKPYSENTAFDRIMKHNEKYYINNNIEESHKKNEYKNPRLKTNQAWEKAWTNYNNEEISEQYYNSTLVIPMSITSENIDPDSLFFKKYFAKSDTNKVNSNTRAILGFVCFDSKEKDYFDEVLDLELAFIITDLISLYLIFYYNYAISSKTVIEYEEKYL